MTEHVGATIRALRQARGDSLRSLAARLEVSPATLSGIERGRTTVTVARLGRIADALGVPAGDLLRGQGVGEPSAGTTPSGPEAATGWRDFAELRLDPVLASATALFVRQGYHATSMREIAAGAGLSVAGTYHHYPSKEQILVALLELTMAELAWRVEAAHLEGEDPAASFALVVEALALFHAVRGDLAFIGASEMRALAPRERARVVGLRDDIQHFLDRQAAVYAGTTASAVDLRTTTRAIATMCTSLPSWFRLDGPLGPHEVARRYARLAVTMIDETTGAAPPDLDRHATPN